MVQIPHANHSPAPWPRLRRGLHDSHDARLPAHEPASGFLVPQRARFRRAVEAAYGEHIPAEGAESEHLSHNGIGKQEVWGAGGTQRGGVGWAWGSGRGGGVCERDGVD